MNKSIMYWKWDDEILDDRILREKIDDLTARTQISTFCVGVHWIERAFTDSDFLHTLKTAATLFHERGRKLCAECCVRNEGHSFFKAHPSDVAYLIASCEIPLNENGCGSISIAQEPVYHYWRKTGDSGEYKLFGAWAMNLTGHAKYSGKPADILQLVKPSSAKNPDNSYTLTLSVCGGTPLSTAVVFYGFPQPIPDLASEHIIEHFDIMAKCAKEAGLDGLISDEWGYDVILKIVEVNPYDDKQLHLSHLSYSEGFERHYQKHFKQTLLDRLYALHYAEEGQENIRKKTIDNYLNTLRLIAKKNDEDMYDITKARLGKDAFWGVHPTWWGSVDSLNFEYFKNGFYWWQAKRDIAQTDEMVLPAIRTALAHKCRSDIWYNMWYSLGSLDIKTYWTETYHNIRFGGRTHYLGYECPNEGVVLALKPQGLLESIEEMDNVIRPLDSLQTTQPDCRVLALFNYEAVGNWAVGEKPLPPWRPQNVRLDKVLNTTNEVFSEYLCDLVPTYEIEDGSLTVKGGKAVYGTQTYDAVICYYMEDMSKKVKAFINKLSSERLIACGGQKLANSHYFNDIPSSKIIVELLNKMQVARNRFENGSVFQDGSIIFSADGKAPAHNPLKVDCEHLGHRIEFVGEDFLFIAADLKRVNYPVGRLLIDGNEIKGESL